MRMPLRAYPNNRSYQGRRKAPARGKPCPPLPEPTQKVCYNDGNQEPRANGLVNELPSKAPREAGRKEVFAIERLK